jgi:hypothetical protein
MWGSCALDIKEFPEELDNECLGKASGVEITNSIIALAGCVTNTMELPIDASCRSAARSSVMVEVMSVEAIVITAGALIIGGSGGPATERGAILLLLAAGTIVLVAYCWGTVEDLIEYYYGRNWPTASAVVDVVSVTMVESKGISSTANHSWPYFLATLTYSYRNPEPQTGEYKRRFANEDDARA